MESSSWDDEMIVVSRKSRATRRSALSRSQIAAFPKAESAARPARRRSHVAGSVSCAPLRPMCKERVFRRDVPVDDPRWPHDCRIEGHVTMAIAGFKTVQWRSGVRKPDRVATSRAAQPPPRPPPSCEDGDWRTLGSNIRPTHTTGSTIRIRQILGRDDGSRTRDLRLRKQRSTELRPHIRLVDTKRAAALTTGADWSS